MIPQYIHTLDLGFLLWADNYLLNKGQAFTVNTSKLYYTPDSRIPSNWVAYSSPFKSWVNDSGVAGAYIPHSISGSFGTINEGQSGMMIDHENGRVIFTGGNFPTNLEITGTYSFKDFNIYPTNDSLEKIIIDNKYYLNSRFGDTESGIQPYQLVTPAIFVNITTHDTVPYAFGGLNNCIPTITMSILAETSWQLDGVLSIFGDSSQKYFPLVDMSMDPVNEYGGLKSGYNYTQIAKNAPLNQYVFIKSAKGSKMSDQLKAQNTLYVGLVDFELENARST